uniref:Sclerostin domain-containing protein 1 n=1 Tax=Schizaphis graminum TaxID=13262 RepID=A0A2S2NIN8_SCHGA
MSMIKSWIIVVSCFAVGNCAGESRKIDEVQYKNHRTSSFGNDTSQNHAMLHKTYPVYPAQVYANLSNVRDFAVKLHTEQQQTLKTTEMPSDVVRVFFTATTTGKKKPLQDAASSTTPVPAAPTTGSVFRTAAPSAYIVTARNVASTDNKDLQQFSPIYSESRSEAEVKYATSSVNFRGVPTVNENESRTIPKFNGSKIRQVLKAQNQAAQSPLLSATTTTPQISPSLASNQRNFSSFTVSAKVNATPVTSSKPFATVLVPKHVLDDGVFHQQEDSFRPIAPPVFTPYKPPSIAVDTNSIVENRRVSDAVVSNKNQPLVNQANADTIVPKLKNYGHTKTLAYKVEEYVPGDAQQSAIPNHDYGNEQDRSDSFSVIADKRDIEKSYMRDHHIASSYYENSPRYDSLPKKIETMKYGFVEPVVEPFKSGSGPIQAREFYQATEWPASVKYEKFDGRSPALSSGLVHTQASMSEPPSKEYYSAPPSSFPPSSYPKTESNGPEFVMGDLNPKDVLKSLLRDILKSKRPAEIKPKSPTTMDEVIDSLISTNQQNSDDTLQDSFDIQTGAHFSEMNCNLRSSKYITDGQCVSTKPVVEVVCADRCLVAANSLSQRHRSSILDNQQVEALQCTDGDVKMVRVQLKCRDGNMFNHVIKVVSSCQCKLHPKQPLMRSNLLSSPRATINPDIMAIAAGQF